MAAKLKTAADRCKLLDKEYQVEWTDLEKALTAAKDARSAMRAMKEELRQAGDIAAGKPFMLRMKFGDPKYAPLDRQWSAANTYLDMAASAADAAEHFHDQTDHEVEKLFWSQFHNPERPVSVSDHLAAWAELNRLSGLSMNHVVSHLWPKKARAEELF